VKVQSAQRVDPDGTKTDLPALIGAKVDLLDDPVLENRNWTLTLPGFEPIVPFHLQIASKGIRIYRDAPIDPDNPTLPIWKVDPKKIMAQGAAGMAWEPGTIGRATGIWDAGAFVLRRRNQVASLLAELEEKHGDPVQIANLRGRLFELDFAVKNPMDRRTLAKSFVERFAFPMFGKKAVVDGSEKDLGGALDAGPPWSINFWIGAWDPDALCAFMEGSLSIPYVAPKAAASSGSPNATQT
jgi:hypothetical protein